MMKKIKSKISRFLDFIKQYIILWRKVGNDIADLFKPKNEVLILLKCPETGEVKREVRGRNIVTSFAFDSSNNNPAYRSGTDVMRRLLINPNSNYGNESLHNTNGASAGVYIEFMELGIGNTPEASSDKGLAEPLGYDNLDGNGDYKGIERYSGSTEPNARKTVTMATGTGTVLETTSTDVTFIGEWDSTQLNGQQLSEIALITSAGTGTNHFFARKTFTPFTKTSEFTLEIRWTIRF